MGVSAEVQYIGEIYCVFVDCPALLVFFVHVRRSNRWTDLYALWLKRRVSTQGSAFSGLGRLVTSIGGIYLQTPFKT